MNKTGYQPMPVLLRAEPNDARWTSKSAKILTAVATLGTLVTLCGAVAICLIGFNAFPRKTLESKPPAAVPILPEATPSVAAATTSHEDGASMPLADSNQADRSILDQTATSTPSSISTPAVEPKAESSATESELPKVGTLQTEQVNPGRHLTEAVRKKLEKRRLAAERKRSRLEESYRDHAISSEAYKKGVEKYQKEIERYRSEMSAGMGPKTNLAGQN